MLLLRPPVKGQVWIHWMQLVSLEMPLLQPCLASRNPQTELVVSSCLIKPPSYLDMIQLAQCYDHDDRGTNGCLQVLSMSF